MDELLAYLLGKSRGGGAGGGGSSGGGDYIKVTVAAGYKGFADIVGSKNVEIVEKVPSVKINTTVTKEE